MASNRLTENIQSDNVPDFIEQKINNVGHPGVLKIKEQQKDSGKGDSMESSTNSKTDHSGSLQSSKASDSSKTESKTNISSQTQLKDSGYVGSLKNSEDASRESKLSQVTEEKQNIPSKSTETSHFESVKMPHSASQKTPKSKSQSQKTPPSKSPSPPFVERNTPSSRSSPPGPTSEVKSSRTDHGPRSGSGSDVRNSSSHGASVGDSSSHGASVRDSSSCGVSVRDSSYHGASGRTSSSKAERDYELQKSEGKYRDDGSSSGEEWTEKDIEELRKALGPNEFKGDIILGERIHPPPGHSPPERRRRPQRRRSPPTPPENFDIQLLMLMAQLGLGGPLGPLMGRGRGMRMGMPGGRLGRMGMPGMGMGMPDLDMGPVDFIEDDDGIGSSLNENRPRVPFQNRNRNYDDERMKAHTTETSLRDSSVGDEGFVQESNGYHDTVNVEHRTLSTVDSQLLYQRNNDGDTQLHLRIIDGDENGIREILVKAPNSSCLDVPNDLYQTPLVLAALCKMSTVVRWLLVAGVDSNYQDRRGDTILHIAVKGGDLVTVKQIVKLISENEYRTRITQSYRPRMYRITPELLNMRNDEGLAPIHYAVMYNSMDILEALRNAGANIDRQTGKTGNRPLHLAVQYKRVGIIHFFADTCKINLERGNFKNVPALILAASLRRFDIVAILIEYGADWSEMNVPINDQDELAIEKRFYRKMSLEDDPGPPVEPHKSEKVKFFDSG